MIVAREPKKLTLFQLLESRENVYLHPLLIEAEKKN